MAARSIHAAAIAGLWYFAIVFSAGFVLGVARALVLLPRLGETAAVLLELPVILALSWLACRSVVAWLAVPETIIARLIMGGLAFMLLIMAEFALATLGLGRSMSEHFMRYGRLPEMLGLAGQFLFAALPSIDLALKRSNEP